MNQEVLLFSIRFRTLREKEYEPGREVVSRWHGTLIEMQSMSRGILSGLCKIGGYKGGVCDIYEVNELEQKLVDRIYWYALD